MTDQPNFVIIIPDQLRADALGCFGNPIIQTPHIDALAASGTMFSEAYVQHPVCSPSRASFLTGWYPHVRGHRTLDHLLQADEPNLLRILKDAGYHVCWAGKRGDTFAPGVTELSAHEYGFVDAPAGPFIGGEFPSDVWARLFYRGELPAGSVDHDEAAVRSVEARLVDPPPEPWVMFVALFAPHCPFQVEQPWFSMYDRSLIPDPLPPSPAEPGFKTAIRKRHGLERVTAEMWREVAAVYYGMVSRMDRHVGRIGAAVEKTASASRTVTFFFADHGEFLGDFGLIEKWPSAMDRCITADPLIISGGGLPLGQHCGAMTELIDVLPTVLDLAGIKAPHDHFGRSLLPVLEQPDRDHRRFAFTEGGFSDWEEPKMERPTFPYDLKGAIQHDSPRLVGRAVAIRGSRWTYVWRLYEPPELYDRSTDPAERINVAGAPEHAGVEREMERALLAWHVETSDVLPDTRNPRFPAVELPSPAARAVH